MFNKLHVQPPGGLDDPATASYIIDCGCGNLFFWGIWNIRGWVGGGLDHDLSIRVWFGFYIVVSRGLPYVDSVTPQLSSGCGCYVI